MNTKPIFTFVMPTAPTLPPYVDVACPHPMIPEKNVQSPSMAIPLLVA